MEDIEIWRNGVDQVIQQIETLPLERLAIVKSGIRRLMCLKAAMHAVVEKTNGESACAACGGKCCVCGKYHFSAIDLVAYRNTGIELFTPDFSSGQCPFLSSGSCCMSAEYRPFNCVTFVCEELENNFSHAEKDEFYRLERELRDLYAELQQLFPNRRMQRSVMSFLQAEGL